MPPQEHKIFDANISYTCQENRKAYLEPTAFIRWQISQKNSITDVELSSKYASDVYVTKARFSKFTTWYNPV